MILVIQTLISYTICCALASDLSIGSKINKYELDNIRYQIDIDQNLQPSSATQSKSDHIPIRSANGQLFTCSFEPLEYFDQDSEINIEENSLLSLFSKSAIQREHLRLNQNKQSFNFTQIDLKVQEQISKLTKSNVCLYKNNGWWTYEFCVGQLINQYHILPNGSMHGEKISLGNFSHDFDWLGANETKKYPSRSEILYHEQYFEHGSLCELTGRPRKTTVKIFCDERGLDRIEMISEIETCEYEIFVRSQSLCSVPNFSKKQISHDLKCSPVVSDHVFEKYLASKEKKENAQLMISSEIDELTTINKELDQELQISENKLQNLISKTQDVKLDNNFASLNSLIEETNSEMSKNDQMFEKISKKLDNILDEFENGKISAQDGQVPILTESTEILKDTDDLNVEELEKKLKEKLSKSNKFGKDDIKIKIIKLDPNAMFGTSNFNSLISNLLESSDDRQKISKMNNHYNQVYGEDNFGQEQSENVEDLWLDEEAENNLIVY
ncbi:OS-9-like isoform X2 [Brachionus plicatilis]|uniref:OS-9-like isoform X2 n=1 Tax=Brachionus plicatilis TaxID=10195 RepID=A0A3M7S2B1_BRAPC|nr:OS-9-like isoform X2 [Brachionus plicatilis]